MPLNRSFRHALAVSWSVAVVSCGGPPDDQVFRGVAPSADAFVQVSPVLEVHCGTLDCHGSSARNMRVYGIDGVRLDAAGVSGDQSTTPEEVLATYASMITIQPEVLSRVVQEGGRNPERWLPVGKGRETEGHKGGRRMVAGDDTDACITSWLANAVAAPRCEAAAQVEAPGGEAF
jgi:hypothetical protein